MVFIKFPGRVGSGQPNSYRGQKKNKFRHFPPRHHIRHGRHGYGGRHGTAIFNPPHHRYSVAFFQKTATQLRHGATMATI